MNDIRWCSDRTIYLGSVAHSLSSAILAVIPVSMCLLQAGAFTLSKMRVFQGVGAHDRIVKGTPLFLGV